MTSRPPVVLLHGWTVDSRVWGRLEITLGEQYTVLVPDLPGHRGMPVQLDGRPPADYHQHAVEHLGAWWHAVDARNAPVVAWAWGGQVLADAMTQGRLSPRSVALVCGAAPFQTPETYDAILRDWPRFARRLVQVMASQPLSDEYQDWITSLMTSTSLVAVAAVQSRRWEPPTEFVLPPDSIAILGSEDRLTPPGPNRELAEAWGATVHLLDGIGHLPFVEDPASFDAVLRDWLKLVL